MFPSLDIEHFLISLPIRVFSKSNSFRGQSWDSDIMRAVKSDARKTD